MIEQLTDNARDGAISQFPMLDHLSLAAKLEFDNVTANTNVSWPKRGQTVASIFIRVNLTSSPHETRRKDAQHASHNSLAAEIMLSEVLANGSPHSRHRFDESQQALELFLFGPLYVLLVIDVLPATCIILAYGLKHSAGGSIDGYFTPPGWNPQSFNSCEIFASDLAAVSKDVTEMGLFSNTMDPGLLKSFNANHQVKP
jgi:hypothetical protein